MKKIERRKHAGTYNKLLFQGSGRLCKRYWDNSKDGLRTANCPWTISIKKEIKK